MHGILPKHQIESNSADHSDRMVSSLLKLTRLTLVFQRSKAFSLSYESFDDFLSFVPSKYLPVILLNTGFVTREATALPDFFGVFALIGSNVMTGMTYFHTRKAIGLTCLARPVPGMRPGSNAFTVMLVLVSFLIRSANS